MHVQTDKFQKFFISTKCIMSLIFKRTLEIVIKNYFIALFSLLIRTSPSLLLGDSLTYLVVGRFYREPSNNLTVTLRQVDT